MELYNKNYTPDYTRTAAAAMNRETDRIPLYEHLICDDALEQVTGVSLAGLREGKYRDKVEYFRRVCDAWRQLGYDTVSHECCTGGIIAGGMALRGRIPGPVQTREDFERYPWDSMPDRFFEKFGEDYRAFGEALPAGMKGVGGVGNGLFECAEDMVGYIPLCFLSVDDPELYADIFRKLGEVLEAIWVRFLALYGDNYCVLRFGDDLGFKSNTLISARDIRAHILPGYRRIIARVHAAGKPFLLHSCGNIFSVMDDILETGIDAKHSNEDQIAPFPMWVEKYGSRIGNFGGIDTDCVCRLNEQDMKEYITEVVTRCRGRGGFAFGSGNSIPDYVPAENFAAMNRIIRELRKEPR